MFTQILSHLNPFVLEINSEFTIKNGEKFILNWFEDLSGIFTKLIKIYKGKQHFTIPLGMITHSDQEELKDTDISDEQVRNWILNLLEYICRLSFYYDTEWENWEDGYDIKTIKSAIVYWIEAYLEILMIHDELFENHFMLEESLNPIRGLGKVKFMQISSFTQERLAKYCEYILDRNNPDIDQQTQDHIDLLIMISYETWCFQGRNLEILYLDPSNPNLIHEMRESPKKMIWVRTII